MKRLLITALLMFAVLTVVRASPPDGRPVAGPFSVTCTGKGPGLVEWFNGLAPVEANDSWTMEGWVSVDAPPKPRTLIAGFGNGINMPGGERFFAVQPDGLEFWGGGVDVPAGGNLETGSWHHLAATYDGLTVRVYRDGKLVAEQAARLTRTAMQVKLGPPTPWDQGASFAGRIALFSVLGVCLAEEDIAKLAHRSQGDLDRLSTAKTIGDEKLKAAHGDFIQRGLVDVEDPAVWPGPAPKFESHRVAKQPASAPVSQIGPDGSLLLSSGWEMEDAGKFENADGSKISQPDFSTSNWYDATVPGTVLTTLVQQGEYPDPLYGLNNLSIPTDLARRSWWYRTRFQLPADWSGRRITLHFGGINYHAEVWLTARVSGR